MILDLLLCNLLLQLLNLIKAPDQIILKVAFNIISDDFHAVVGMIILAHVQLVLDEAGELLIIVLAVLCISWTLAFEVGAVELCLESEELGSAVGKSCCRGVLSLLVGACWWLFFVVVACGVLLL